jgi:hypothetical protein
LTIFVRGYQKKNYDRAAKLLEQKLDQDEVKAHNAGVRIISPGVDASAGAGKN